MKRVLVTALSFFFVLTIASPARAGTNQVQVSPPSAVTTSPAAPIDPEKEADIRKLLELTGAKSMVNQMIDTMTSLMQKSLMQANPDNPSAQELSNLIAQKLRDDMSTHYDDLLKLMIPLYDKYYSKDDIEQMIQFYGTPLGQKLLKVMPEISRESQTLGYQWGAKLGRDSVAEILREHPELRGSAAPTH